MKDRDVNFVWDLSGRNKMTNKKDSEERDRIKIIKTRLENHGLIGADDIHFAVAIAEEGLKEKTCAGCGHFEELPYLPQAFATRGICHQMMGQQMKTLKHFSCIHWEQKK